jgi:hypothetical protein
MARVIKTFSVDLEKIDIVAEFERIVTKDKSKLGVKSVSEMIVKLIEDYVKAHQNNPVPLLDNWVKKSDFKAYPTLDSDWEHVPLSTFNDKDIQHLYNKAHEMMHFIKEEAKKRGLV